MANNKILYDFADIESYNPDGTYFEFVNDNCNYYDAAGGNELGNWATEWQASHTEGVDWYDCSVAHSEPLNGNLKAYAAWWLWCRLAGWEGVVGVDNKQAIKSIEIYPNPTNEFVVLKSENKINKVEITDISGKLVKNIFDILKNQKINVSDLKKGTYFITTFSNFKNETIRFIKN